MKTILFLVSALTLVACNSQEKVVKENLEKQMKISETNLEVADVTVGDKVTIKEDQKQGLALLGLKDMHSFPITVKFKVKEDCVAVAEALKNDILFNEKKVSCRSIKPGVAPKTQYVKSYGGGFRRIANYEEGKIIKAGETFVAEGELVYMTDFKDQQKNGTMFKGLK